VRSEPAGYSAGEVAALISPVCGVDAEKIVASVLIVLADDGTIGVAGGATVPPARQIDILACLTQTFRGNRDGHQA
jgi:hypothetical protein